MTYRGRVKGGVVVLEEGVSLPEGMEVDVAARVRLHDEVREAREAIAAWEREVARWTRERGGARK